MRTLDTEEVKQIQLDILKGVDAWCRQNNLQYFLGYGTLLGAVRHKGYIPWDDDIDIVMLRPDYERFLKEFNRDRKDNLQALHASIDKDFPYEFAKVQDTRTKLVENTDIAYDIGINIDVFVMDAIDCDEKSLQRILRKGKIPKKVLSYKNMLGNGARRRTGIKKLGVAVIKSVCNMIPIYWCTSTIDSIAKASNRDENTWVGNVCERWFKPSEIMQKEWYDHSVEIEFEGNRFQAPEKYDEVLTAWYGDYMQLPPEEERVTHHDYEAYQR